MAASEHIHQDVSLHLSSPLLGHLVALHGIQDKPALNGSLGVATHFIQEKGLYTVNLIKDRSDIALKPINLKSWAASATGVLQRRRYGPSRACVDLTTTDTPQSVLTITSLLPPDIIGGDNTVFYDRIDDEARRWCAAQLSLKVLHLHSVLHCAASKHTQLPPPLVKLVKFATGNTLLHAAIADFVSGSASDKLALAAQSLRVQEDVLQSRVVHYVRHIVPNACLKYLRDVKNLEKYEGAHNLVQYHIEESSLVDSSTVQLTRKRRREEASIDLCHVQESAAKLLTTSGSAY